MCYLGGAIGTISIKHFIEGKAEGWVDEIKIFSAIAMIQPHVEPAYLGDWGLITSISTSVEQHPMSKFTCAPLVNHVVNHQNVSNN